MSHQVLFCSAKASFSDAVTQDAVICTASCCGSGPQRVHPKSFHCPRLNFRAVFMFSRPMDMIAVLSQYHYYIFEFQYVYVWMSVGCHVVCIALCLATDSHGESFAFHIICSMYFSQTQVNFFPLSI